MRSRSMERNATNNYFDDIIGRYRIPYLYGEEADPGIPGVGQPLIPLSMAEERDL